MRAVLISLAVIFIVTAVCGLAWLSRRDSGINFLPQHQGAEWILFPAAVDAKARSVVDLDTLFGHEFTVESRPPKAFLAVRALKRVQVRINDQRLDLIDSPNWKDASTVEVSGLLHDGQNKIEARVFNDNGPPALWLSLTADQLSLRSDQSWIASCAGSAWRGAVLANAPRFPGRGNPIDSSERTITALVKIWPLWVLFAFAAVILCLGGSWCFRQQSANVDWLTFGNLIGIIALWLILFWHNAPILPPTVGFDAAQHLNYIKYLQEHHRLPLPAEGIQMFQPPLYYTISAFVLSLFRLATADPSAILVLRGLTMLFGITQILLVFASLRLIFPDRPSLQLVGCGVMAFLPMHLYLSYYPTNETLAGVLLSACVYLALRMVRSTSASRRNYNLLGLLMGAALLTKASAILVVPFIILALARQLFLDRAASAKWVTTLCSMVVIATLICSWHYLRVSRFGSPLVGGWNPETGLFWWQDDGYRTIAYFTRFGQSLVHPFFSVTASFMDGLYSTLWGDGLCSGVSSSVIRPPWNYELISAGYLLSLLPTTFLLIGAVTALAQLFRDLRSDIFIMLGLSAALVVALIYFNLRVPCYASVKAFYGIGALIPFGFFVATGWNIATRRSRVLQLLIGTLLVVWVINSFASFWIYNPVAEHTHAAMYRSIAQKPDAAVAEARKAVAADPVNAAARIALAITLEDAKQSGEALDEAERATKLAPQDGAAHLELGGLLFKQNKLDRAIEEARLAVAYAPENTQAYLLLLLSLLSHNDDPVGAAREALAVSPYNAEIHRLLGVALAQKRESVDAFNHLAYTVLLRPEWADAHSELQRALLAITNSSDGARLLHQAAASIPDSSVALDELAWIFATHPSDELRDGNEAVRLAEHACALTKRTNPISLATLASAYAETGNFNAAINTIQQSISKARSSNNTDAIALGERLLGFFQSNKPVRQDPNSS